MVDHRVAIKSDVDSDAVKCYCIAFNINISYVTTKNQSLTT